MGDSYLDPRDVYAEELQSWEELWNREDTLYSNVKSIVEQSVLLPNAHIMLPVVCTYLCVPSKWSKILPILFSFGDKGSGKSTLATIGSKLHGVPIFSAADTFASLRNALDQMRWIDRESKDYEQEGAILCWDNIHAQTLINDQKIYQMLLFGYSRASEIINIATVNGENLSFHVFSPKVMSSVDRLHSDLRFKELHRRLLIIPHKPYEKFSKAEIEASKFSVLEKLDLDSIDWTGMSDEFLHFWSNADNCRQYARHRSYLTRKGAKKFTIPPTFRGEQWTVSIDLICTGLLIGTWTTYQEAVDSFAEYWHWANSSILNNQSATAGELQLFIEEQIGQQRKQNEIYLAAGMTPEPLVINPERLRDRLNFLQGSGRLDDNPKLSLIKEVMRDLGWRLKEGQGWIELD